MALLKCFKFFKGLGNFDSANSSHDQTLGTAINKMKFSFFCTARVANHWSVLYLSISKLHPELSETSPQQLPPKLQIILLSFFLSFLFI